MATPSLTRKPTFLRFEDFSQSAAASSIHSPIRSSEDVLAALSAMGCDFDRMHAFCALDPKHLGIFLCDIQTPFEFPRDHYIRSRVISHCAKAYAAIKQFDKSFALIATISVSSETIDALKYHMQQANSLHELLTMLELLESLYNLTLMQKLSIQKELYSCIACIIKAGQESSVDTLFSFLKAQSSSHNLDDFCEDLFRHFIKIDQKDAARVCLNNIYSLPRKESLCRLFN